VANDGNAWQYSLEAVKQFFVRVDSEQMRHEPPAEPASRPLDSAREPYGPLAHRLLGGDLEWAERLGQRTAQLHDALSQVADDPAFAPEPLRLNTGKTNVRQSSMAVKRPCGSSRSADSSSRGADRNRLAVTRIQTCP
jgi:predicted trehalose synthase